MFHFPGAGQAPSGWAGGSGLLPVNEAAFVHVFGRPPERPQLNGFEFPVANCKGLAVAAGSRSGLFWAGSAFFGRSNLCINSAGRGVGITGDTFFQSQLEFFVAFAVGAVFIDIAKVGLLAIFGLAGSFAVVCVKEGVAIVIAVSRLAELVFIGTAVGHFVVGVLAEACADDRVQQGEDFLITGRAGIGFVFIYISPQQFITAGLPGVFIIYRFGAGAVAGSAGKAFLGQVLPAGLDPGGTVFGAQQGTSHLVGKPMAGRGDEEK